MIWQYFPTAMCFPIEPDTEEARRACWHTALSALAASPHYQVQLYDAKSKSESVTGEETYFCILCHRLIGESRADFLAWKQMHRLLPELLLEHPFWQANELEPHAPFRLLGTVSEIGGVHPTSDGEALLPKALPDPMEQNVGRSVLLVADSSERMRSVRAEWRSLAHEGYRVVPLLLSDGGIGTAFAWVTACKGRWEQATCDVGGEQREVSFGVLPGGTAVFEPSALGESKETAQKGIRTVLETGYRAIVVAGADLSFPEEEWTTLLWECSNEADFTVLLSKSGQSELVGNVRFSDGIEETLLHTRAEERAKKTDLVRFVGKTAERGAGAELKRRLERSGTVCFETEKEQTGFDS